MIIHHDVHIDQARLVVIEITETSAQLISLFEQDELESVVASDTYSEKRKKEFLGARLALKRIANTVDVGYTESGKPYPKKKNFQMSISHSGNYVAVIIHPNREVGVDIEINSDKISRVYQRLLSSHEQAYLYSEHDLRKTQIAWSTKEALYKIIGRDVVDFSQELEINDFEIEVQGTFTAKRVSINKSFDLSYIQTAIYTLVYCIA